MLLQPQLIHRWLLLLLLTLPLAATAKTITVASGDTLRNIANTHLGDSELWPEILLVNQLQSAADIYPGMVLTLPPEVIMEVRTAQLQLQRNLTLATDARATVHAHAEMVHAFSLQSRATEMQRRRDWNTALELTQQANKYALQALEICNNKQNIAAFAQLWDYRGTVEKRSTADTVWHALKRQDPLAEGDKVRTLSQTTAEILFLDESRLRMSENSQVVLKKMRANLIEKRQQASVRLLSGDIFALLGENQQRNRFDIDIPGVDISGTSRDFYVKKEKDSTKLANYQGELEISDGNKLVKLEKNEGISVDEQGFSDKKRLLAAASKLLPADNTIHYSNNITLQWQEVSERSSYRLEIATDSLLQQLVINQTEITQPQFNAASLMEGDYYWRVTAMDREGFPGEKSGVQKFTIIIDDQPPLLAIYTPKNGQTFHRSTIQIEGVTEDGATLQLNGKSVTVQANGSFAEAVTLQEGENQLQLIATDPAGNTTTIQRTLQLESDVALFLQADASLPQSGANRYLSRGDLFTYRAKLPPQTTVTVSNAQGETVLQHIYSPDGQMSVTLPSSRQEQHYQLLLQSRSGKRLQQEITVVRAATVQPLRLTRKPPHYTATANHTIVGNCDSSTKQLWLNDTPVEHTNGNFNLPVTLQPGKNHFTIRAVNPLYPPQLSQFTVTYDQQIPKISHKSVSIRTSATATIADISLTASDTSPLYRTVRYQLQSGDFQHSGLLQRTASKNGNTIYSGQVYLPTKPAATPQLTIEYLSDIAGNSYQE